ncbi:hypothetical protein [Thalassospira sp.]|uniref:hypothetical protein n=1 Tax=Thalassospira sp. TaxID=1912094 RepID=UPI0025DA0758|nr:hypothetical protein [Thalassospira sp.]|tara:strand:+ start:221 stop:403 length:183 start_codon:yes stop_codon:yes gene_type:complete
MNIPLKPIRTEADHDAALELLETLWDAKPGSPEADQLETLGALINQYEEQKFSTTALNAV